MLSEIASDLALDLDKVSSGMHLCQVPAILMFQTLLQSLG